MVFNKFLLTIIMFYDVWGRNKPVILKFEFHVIIFDMEWSGMDQWLSNVAIPYCDFD